MLWLKLRDALDHEERVFRHQSRILWLSTRDSNTSFFHRSLLIHHAKNEIRNLRDAQGQPIPDDQLLDAGRAHFSATLTIGDACQPLPLGLFDGGVTDQDNSAFCALASLEELCSTIWGMNREKVPSLDGFNLCFFRASWDVIKEDLLGTVNNFIRSGRLLRSVNHTTLKLIPKGAALEGFSDIRPISLCNVLYRIISCLLAVWLKPILT